jgi:selenocysteine-specific elongation factor
MTYHREAFEKAKETVIGNIRKSGGMTIAELRDKLSLSRKYAQAVLEYLDKTGVTQRVGDKHILK